MLPKRLFCWIGRLPRVGISRGTIDTMSHIGQKGRGQPGGHGGRGRGLPSDPTRMYMNHEYNLRNGQSGYAANMVAGGQSRHWIQSSNGQWHQQGMATPGTFSNGSNMPNAYQERLQQQEQHAAALHAAASPPWSHVNANIGFNAPPPMQYQQWPISRRPAPWNERDGCQSS